jgi:putative FmdB family regulatory protein
MPIYTYKCYDCETTQEAHRNMKERKNAPQCECGGETRQIITAVNIGAYSTKVMEPFISPASGKPIETERARREDMKRSGCRPWEGLEQEKKEVERKKKYNDEKLDKAVTNELHKTAAKMNLKL